MTDDDFEDIIEQICYYYPLIAKDRYAKAEYDRVAAKVANTGGEEQRARLLEVIEELQTPPIQDYEMQAEDAGDSDSEK